MSNISGIKAVVIGGLNTDIVAAGINNFPKVGGYTLGKELKIGPGGKSRNIADMLAHLLPAGSVAMVGRTVRDPYGLWELPVEALTKVTVNTDYINVLDYETANKLPAVALIPVDESGNNQIFVLPGISEDFDVSDIENASPLFVAAAANDGLLILTLECPLDTVLHAIKKANSHGLKVMLDPGGIQPDMPVTELLSSGVFLIKPNEHEAEIMTGVKVTDKASARKAAAKLQSSGIENVVITLGVKGAYLFTKNNEYRIPIPKVSSGTEKDETGCGDQSMAALSASLLAGKSLHEAVRDAVLAGTLQFHRSGIQPLSADELKTARTHK